MSEKNLFIRVTDKKGNPWTITVPLRLLPRTFEDGHGRKIEVVYG